MKRTFFLSKITLLLCLLFSFTHCKKTGTGCWQAFDPAGYSDAPGLVLCDKTKAEAEAAYPQFWFYRSGEAKSCWKVTSGGRDSYLPPLPKSITEKYRQERGLTFTEVACNSFCALEWNEKHKGKLTNQFGPTYRVTEMLFSADSCSKLSIGRIIIMKETTDSLVTRELVNKAP